MINWRLPDLEDVYNIPSIGWLIPQPALADSERPLVAFSSWRSFNFKPCSSYDNVIFYMTWSKTSFSFSSRHLQVSNQVSVKIVPDCMVLRFSVQIGTSGSLGNDDGDGNKNGRKKNNRFKWTPLHVQHAFLYISLPSLHDYHLKVTGHVLYTVNGFESVYSKF